MLVMRYICLFLLLFSCSENSIDLKDIIEKRALHHSNEHGFALKLDTVSFFDWDSLLVVKPYANLDYIEEDRGYDLSRIPNLIKHHDSLSYLFFCIKTRG